MALVDMEIGNPEPHFLHPLLAPSKGTPGHLQDFQTQIESQALR